MHAIKTATVAALFGGLAWFVQALLVWGSGGGPDNGGGGNGGGALAAVCYVVGAVALAAALLAGGYSTVSTAPLWLRAVVPVAALLLGWIVLGSISTAAGDLGSGDGWARDEVGVLVFAAVALVAGAAGLVRVRTVAPPPRSGAPETRRTAGHRAPDQRSSGHRASGHRTPEGHTSGGHTSGHRTSGHRTSGHRASGRAR